MAKPFARSLMMFDLIQAAMGDPAKLAGLPEYKSRGKGKGLYTGKKWGPRPSYNDMVQHSNGLWYQKENGARECARRVRQGLRDRFNAAAREARADGFTTAAKVLKNMAAGSNAPVGAVESWV